MRSVVPSTGSPSSCCVFRRVSIVSSLTFAYDLHLGLLQLLSLRLISMCFSEGCVSATYPGSILLSRQSQSEAESQAEPKRSDLHSEQDVPAGITGSGGGPKGRGGDLQSDLQAV